MESRRVSRCTFVHFLRKVVKKHVSHIDEIHMLSQLGSLLRRRELVELSRAHLDELREAWSLEQRVSRQPWWHNHLV